MPSNELFSFQILVNGQPLPEYAPEEDDYVYPSRNLNESAFDRVSYAEASPGSEFSLRVTYLGAKKLSKDLAFNADFYIDGNMVRGKMFYRPKNETKDIHGKRIAGGMEQVYELCLLIFSGFKFSEINFTENPVAREGADGNGLKSESIGCIQLVVKKTRGVKLDGKIVSRLAPSGTSSLKVWEQDKKIAGKISLATRYNSMLTLKTKFRRYSASKENYWHNL
jgi:hypothetical protein